MTRASQLPGTRSTLFLAFSLLAALAFPASTSAETLTLWHSYRGAEEEGLHAAVAAFEDANPSVQVEVLAQPQESYAAKLTTAIPRNNGPDLFVFAHDRIGGWALAGLLIEQESEWGDFVPETVNSAHYENKSYGLPLAFKSTALFYNKALVTRPPKTTDEMIAIAREHTRGDRFGLAYLYDDFYFHAAWHFGFGATLLGDEPEPMLAIDSPESIAAMDFVVGMHKEGLLPEEPTSALISDLFNRELAAMVISGPWFLGEVDPSIDLGMVPLPIISAVGKPARPYLSTDLVMVSAFSPRPNLALALSRFLAGPEGARIRAKVGGQAVAAQAVWDDPILQGDPIRQVLRYQSSSSIPMSSDPRARLTWEPFKLALRKLFRQGVSPEDAAQAGLARFRAIARPAPPPVAAWPYLIVLAMVGFLALALFVRNLRVLRDASARKAARKGWAWILPAVVGATLLLFVPFAVGQAVAFFSHQNGDWSFVGTANFEDILSSRHFPATEPLSFYFALVVTVLWTLVNLVLHVGIGFGLALILSEKGLKLRPLYRVLFIIPWAVPNYITALIWKNMFDKQRGVLNSLLESVGAESVSWFSSFGTAFFANVCANAWLGFPFMMVVCLGALQSIPKDLYEAADVDGASKWMKFRHITIPLVKPALVPAMLIGTVWTFNQFNVVYLVSGGEPDNSTDILISEAYRWAFARQERYGYAAAYAVLIFVLLLAWSAFAARVGRRMEEAQ